MRFFSLIVILTVTFTNLAFSATYTAKSGSRSDIQAAINLAKPGDFVKIPAGTFDFDGSISMKAGITLMGAGQDLTVLRRTGSTSAYTFTVDGSNGYGTRISGMTILGRAPTKSPGIKLINGCKDFRIDHITFRRCFDRAIEVHGNAHGVIDHNIFIDNWYTAVVVYGDESASWNRPLNLGSSQAVYVEDNYFEQKNIGDDHMSHHIASNNGSRYVFRYNTSSDGYMSPQAIDVHGNKFGGQRGSRSYEIYGNKVHATHRWLGMLIRGGDGVIYDNVLTGSFTRPIDLMHEGRNGDGNCSYPCVDQIRDLYMWNNTYNGKTANVNVRHPSLIKQGRDYYFAMKPGYVPYTYPHPLTDEPRTAVLSKDMQRTGTKGLSISAGMNPFVSFTQIKYSIPVDQGSMPVSLRVYNAQGKLVRTLVNAVQHAGEHEVIWDGFSEGKRALANGLYTLELTVAGSKVSDRVMIFR